MTKIKGWSMRYVVAICACLCALIIVINSAYNATSIRQALQQQAAILQEQLIATQIQLTQSKRNERKVRAELSLEQASQQQNKVQINQLTAELISLRKELLVYQTIMAPELVNSGLSLLNWQLSGLGEQRYQFTFLLYQASQAKKVNQGRLSLILFGELNQQSAQLDLLKLAGFEHSPTNFKFHYFQLFEGEFTLPEGFVAQRIELDAVKPTLKWQKFEQLTQTLPWLPIN